MKALAAVVWVAALGIIASQASGQSRFGYGSGYSDGFYREAARQYGVVPYQNSRFGYGLGRFGYGDSRFGTGNTRFGEQNSPYGEQLGSYGVQYNPQGASVPSDWTPANPVYNPIVSGTVLPPLAAKPAAAAPQTPLPPAAPATQPARPAGTPKAAPASRPAGRE